MKAQTLLYGNAKMQKEMKNRIVFLLIAACCAASCAKEEKIVSSEETFVDYQDLTCAISSSSRTTLGTEDNGVYPVVWKDADAIKLFSDTESSGRTYTTALSENSAIAVFAPDEAGVPVSQKRYALYPANRGIALSDGKLNVDFSGLRNQVVHTSVANNAENITKALLYSIAEAGETNLVFTNLCGSISLKLNDYQGFGARVHSVRLVTDKAISGTGLVDAEGNIVLCPTGAESYSATVVSHTAGGQSITKNPATVNASTSFLFILPANTYNNLEFTITMEDGRVFSMSSARQVTVEAGVNKGYPVLQLTTYYGSANCLMLEPGQSGQLDIAPYYTFNSDYTYENRRVLAGDGSYWVPEGLNSEILWELAEKADASVSGSVLATCSVEGTNLNVKAASSEGNALVAVKDASGTVLWSFHIWVTDTPADLAYTAINGGILQDRDLGATNTDKCDVSKNLDCIGLHYQWGRKDPFAISRAALPAGAKTGSADFNAGGFAQTSSFCTSTTATDDNGNIAWSIKNPTVRIKGSGVPYRWYKGAQGTNTGEELAFWGSKVKTTWETEAEALAEPNGVKTVYDPCPAGYKVTEAKFMNFVKGTNAVLASPGYNVKYDGTNTNYWAPGGIWEHNTDNLRFRGYRVCTWTATGNLNYPICLYAFSSGIYIQTHMNRGRASACPVRCRKEDSKTDTSTNMEEPEDE